MAGVSRDGRQGFSGAGKPERRPASNGAADAAPNVYGIIWILM
jgi:hypothetical protein